LPALTARQAKASALRATIETDSCLCIKSPETPRLHEKSNPRARQSSNNRKDGFEVQCKRMQSRVDARAAETDASGASIAHVEAKALLQRDEAWESV
jgi:hypothetical protein